MTEPTLNSHYRPDIDGLRAIAVLAVLFSHFFPHAMSGGFVGVDIFFVISGYLITQVLARSLESGKPVIQDFYRRRILRIFPALILVLFASWVMGWFFLLGKEFATLASGIKSSAFFIQNFSLYKASGYFAPPSELNPLLHIWSLSVEEQFYLLYPLLFLFFVNRRTALISGFIIASLLWNVQATYSNPPGAFYLPWGRAWELLVGALVYQWGSKTSALSGREKPRLSNVFSTLALLAIFITSIALDRTSRFPGLLAITPVLSAAIFLITPASFINNRLLSQPALVGIGLISYPLYLWHWPILSFARTVIGKEPDSLTKAGLILSSGILAALTYKFVEKPIRFGKGDSLLQRNKVAGLLISIIGIGVLGIWTAHHGGLPDRKIMVEAQSLITKMRETEEALHREYPDQKCSEVTTPFRHAVECSAYGKTPAKKTIVIWGDSHAGSWKIALYAIAKERNYRIIVFKHPGCAPLLGTRRRTWEPNITPRACEEFGLAEEVIDAIRAIHPNHVFLTARWSLYTSNPPFFLTTEQAPNAPATLDSAKAAFTTQIPLTLQTLRTISPVTVIYEPPQLKLQVDSPAGSGIAKSRDLFEPDSSRHLTLQSITREIFKSEVLKNSKDSLPLDVFDPGDLTCYDGVCHAIINSTVLYLDDNHVSPQGSLLFQKMLAQHLEK